MAMALIVATYYSDRPVNMHSVNDYDIMLYTIFFPKNNLFFLLNFFFFLPFTFFT